MSQYLVTTPKNPEYSGKAFGVRFDKGRAVVNPFSIDASLGLSVEEIARRMEKDLQYHVEPIDDEPQAKAKSLVSDNPADWVDELEQAVEKKVKAKKRVKAGADVPPEDEGEE